MLLKNALAMLSKYGFTVQSFKHGQYVASKAGLTHTVVFREQGGKVVDQRVVSLTDRDDPQTDYFAGVRARSFTLTVSVALRQVREERPLIFDLSSSPIYFCVNVFWEGRPLVPHAGFDLMLVTGPTSLTVEERALVESRVGQKSWQRTGEWGVAVAQSFCEGTMPGPVLLDWLSEREPFVANLLQAIQDVIAQRPPPPRSWKVAVFTGRSKTPSYNALRFPTREAAQAYGEDLCSRWTATTGYEVEPSEDEVNR